VPQGEEKLKSIRNMIYLLLGKIDSRCCNNQLVQIMIEYKCRVLLSSAKLSNLKVIGFKKLSEAV
jgi:hypothetical protein